MHHLYQQCWQWLMENVSASMNYSMILSCSAVAWSVYFEQQYPTLSEDNGDPPPKLKRPVPKPRKRKPQRIIAGDDHLATYNQQPLDSHHLISNSSLSATKWVESQPTSSQQGFQHQHKSADSMKDETRDSVIFTLMWQYVRTRKIIVYWHNGYTLM